MITHKVSVPLANDGYFFAEMHTVAMTARDVEDSTLLRMTEMRQAQIQANIEAAIEALSRCQPQGRC